MLEITSLNIIENPAYASASENAIYGLAYLGET